MVSSVRLLTLIVNFNRLTHVFFGIAWVLKCGIFKAPLLI